MTLDSSSLPTGAASTQSGCVFCDKEFAELVSSPGSQGRTGNGYIEPSIKTRVTLAGAFGNYLMQVCEFNLNHMEAQRLAAPSIKPRGASGETETETRASPTDRTLLVIVGAATLRKTALFSLASDVDSST